MSQSGNIQCVHTLLVDIQWELVWLLQYKTITKHTVFCFDICECCVSDPIKATKGDRHQSVHRNYFKSKSFFIHKKVKSYCHGNRGL